MAATSSLECKRRRRASARAPHRDPAGAFSGRGTRPGHPRAARSGDLGDAALAGADHAATLNRGRSLVRGTRDSRTQWTDTNAGSAANTPHPLRHAAPGPCRQRTNQPDATRGEASPFEVMRAAQLHDYCLALPGSAETFPFGPETSVFKVAGKIFALSRLAQRPLQVSVKCEPLLAERLRDAHPAVLPGYHLNKRHWNTVTIDGSIPDRMLKDMVEDSYDLVVSGLPRSRRRALGWRAGDR